VGDADPALIAWETDFRCDEVGDDWRWLVGEACITLELTADEAETFLVTYSSVERGAPYEGRTDAPHS
jgi:hypothetical protein